MFPLLLKTIYDVIPHFKLVPACNRIFTTGRSVNKTGVRVVTYTGIYEDGETDDALCRCIHGYEHQIDWLKGSTATCTSDKKRKAATLTLTGQPDPNFNKATPDNVFLLLKKTFDQFPLAQIDRLNCRPTATALENGCFDFKLTCNLLPNSLDNQKLCNVVLNYINQDKWLDKVSSPCIVEGNVLTSVAT